MKTGLFTILACSLFLNTVAAQSPGTCHLMPPPNSHTLICFDVTGSRAYEFASDVTTPPTPPIPAISYDVSALLVKLDAIDAHITAVDTKFTAYENEPPWLKKVFTNPTVLAIIGTFATTYAGCRAAGKC